MAGYRFRSQWHEGWRWSLLGPMLLAMLLLEWWVGMHAAAVPYQASLFVVLPVIYLIYGVVAGLTWRRGEPTRPLYVLPAVSRGLGIILNASAAYAPGPTLILGFTLLGVPIWLEAAAVVSVVVAVRRGWSRRSRRLTGLPTTRLWRRRRSLRGRR